LIEEGGTFERKEQKDQRRVKNLLWGSAGPVEGGVKKVGKRERGALDFAIFIKDGKSWGKRELEGGGYRKPRIRELPCRLRNGGREKCFWTEVFKKRQGGEGEKNFNLKGGSGCLKLSRNARERQRGKEKRVKGKRKKRGSWRGE